MKRVWLALVVLGSSAVLIGWWATHRSAPVPTGAAVAVPEIATIGWRIALALGLVLLMIAAAIYALRASGAPARFKSSRHMQVVERCSLGPKRALYSVRIGERMVIVGATDGSIHPVLELSTDESRALYPSPAKAPGAAVAFAEVMQRWAGGAGVS